MNQLGFVVLSGNNLLYECTETILPIQLQSRRLIIDLLSGLRHIQGEGQTSSTLNRSLTESCISHTRQKQSTEILF